MSHPCLIIIDWQKGFRDIAFWGLRNNPDAETNATQLLAQWRARDWPIIHVRHDSVEQGSVLRPGLPGNELEDFCRPRVDEPVYAKTVNSAFIGTTLEDDLRARGLKELVFMGVTTDHCVNTTVRMAANLGFEVIVAADACYTFDRQMPDGRKISAETIHDVHLVSLAGEFARVMTVEEILAETAST